MCFDHDSLSKAFLISISTNSQILALCVTLSINIHMNTIPFCLSYPFSCALAHQYHKKVMYVDPKCLFMHMQL